MSAATTPATTRTRRSRRTARRRRRWSPGTTRCCRSSAACCSPGPTSRPQNISNGLQHFPTTRYGGNGPTSDPRPALVGAGTGKYGFVVDAVEWRWRPDFTVAAA